MNNSYSHVNRLNDMDDPEMNVTVENETPVCSSNLASAAVGGVVNAALNVSEVTFSRLNLSTPVAPETLAQFDSSSKDSGPLTVQDTESSSDLNSASISRPVFENVFKRANASISSNAINSDPFGDSSAEINRFRKTLFCPQCGVGLENYYGPSDNTGK